MYTKYYLVIPCRTLGMADLPMRSLNASWFCRFYVDDVEVLRTSVLPLPGDACWFSRARIEGRLLLYIVVMPWEGKPSTLLYWKIPCIGARIPRRSCSSTTLVLPLPAPLTRWVSVAGRLVRSIGWRSRLRLRSLREGRMYLYVSDVWWTLRYEESFVLTPQAGAFVHGGQALVDGIIWGSSSRLLVEFLLERYELYAHTPSFQCNNVMGSWLFCYHPIIFSLNFVKGCSGKGLVKISAICSSVLVW